MPKLKPLSSEQLIKILKKIGFNFVRQKGSHATYIGKDNRIIVIPIHSNTKR